MERLDLGPPLSQPIVGIILERQLVALGRNIWKDGARSLANHLLDQLSLLYEVWPIRKMRILVRRLEFSYFSVVADPGWDATETLAEVDRLSRIKVFPHFLHSQGPYSICLYCRTLVAIRGCHISQSNTSWQDISGLPCISIATTTASQAKQFNNTQIMRTGS